MRATRNKRKRNERICYKQLQTPKNAEYSLFTCRIAGDSAKHRTPLSRRRIVVDPNPVTTFPQILPKTKKSPTTTTFSMYQSARKKLKKPGSNQNKIKKRRQTSPLTFSLPHSRPKPISQTFTPRSKDCRLRSKCSTILGLLHQKAPRPKRGSVSN